MKKKVLYCILISLFSFAQFSYGQSYLELLASGEFNHYESGENRQF